MKNSINYNLKLPEIQDIVKVSDLSENFIEIDKQMKINSDAITNMKQVEVVDNLTSTAKDKALSANQGSQLKGAINEINTSLSSHKAESTQQAHLAKNIRLEDMTGNFVATELEGAMNELFTNVSNGKDLVSGAITGVDDSVVIPTNPTFNDLRVAISKISTGKKWASGTTNPSVGSLTISVFSGTWGDNTNSTRYIEVNNLDFKPSIIIIRPTVLTSAGTTFYLDGLGSHAGVQVAGSSGRYIYAMNSEVIEITNNGFRLPCGVGSQYWIAIE